MARHFSLSFIFLFFIFSFFAQSLEIGPILKNYHIDSKGVQLKNLNNTFDSSFVFIPDTIQLPFFDDFSTNKFQKYQITSKALTLILMKIVFYSKKKYFKILN